MRHFSLFKNCFAGAALILMATVFLYPSPPMAHAEPPASSKEKSSDRSVDLVKEFDKFVQEWKTQMNDLPGTKRDVKEWLEGNDMEDQVDSFMSKLDQHADNPEAAMDDFDRWIKQKRREKEQRSDKIVDFKTFQTKVFFGGWATFFTIVVILFILKYGFNILRDSFVAARNKILDLFGLQVSTTYDHLSPLPLAPQTRDPEPRKAPPAKRKRKSWLFGEVLNQFINPFVDASKIDVFLEEQGKMKPSPKIGTLLKEAGMITDKEIEQTMAKQKKFRRG